MNTTLINTLDADGQRRVANVREAAGRIWARPLHRYYTDHTVAHTERVIALMDGLTAGMMGTDRRLAPDEVFVLLAAAYLHDIGMQDERCAAGNLDEIRSDHHELSAELIYKAAEDPAQAVKLGLPDDPDLVEAVALAAKGHRKVDLGADEYKPLAHGGVTIRLGLLAALLRFGDGLDIDHRRVDLEMIKLMNLPLDSQLHWWKCHYVGGVRIEDEYIKIAYRFPQDRPDYESFIVPLVEGDIRDNLAELEEIFRANAIKAAIAKSQVRLMRLVQVMPGEVEELAKSWWQSGRDTESQVNIGPKFAPQLSEHPTASELRQFVETDFQRLEDALNDVWVSVGGSPLVKYAVISTWEAISSRVAGMPEDIGAVLEEVVKTRDLAWGGPTRVTRDQLLSAKQGVSQILRFLSERFPAAGVELSSGEDKGSVSGKTDALASPQSTVAALPDYKRKALEEQRAALLEDYEVASAQLSSTLSEVDRVRIKRQLADLERQIQEIEISCKARPLDLL